MANKLGVSEDTIKRAVRIWRNKLSAVGTAAMGLEIELRISPVKSGDRIRALKKRAGAVKKARGK